MTGALRVGILIDDWAVPAWQARVIDELSSEAGLHLCVLVRDPPPAPRPRGRDLVSLYQFLDARLHRAHGEALLPVALRTNGEVPRLAEADLSSLGRYDLDVLVGLASREPSASEAACARYGLWRLRFGDPRDDRDRAPAFWETFDGRSTVAIDLRALDGSGRWRELCSGRFDTHDYSLVRTRVPALVTAGSFFIRTLRQLRDRGWSFIEERSRPVDVAMAPGGAPSNVEMIPFLARYVGRIGRKVIHWSLFDIYHWSVALAPRAPNERAAQALRQAPFRTLDSPADCVYADPILFEHDGDTWLFLEQCTYQSGRAVIAVAKIEADGRPSPFQVVLQRDYDLSNPFVFRRHGVIYMIPESGDNRTIELYRCERFPDRWTLERVLVENVAAYDTVIHEHDGRLWLFSGITEKRGFPGTLELHLFHAKDLDSDFTPHPRNPVVSDVTRARPAGAILVEDGMLIRPGQDCAGRYGRAISLSRIDRLTPDDYHEEVVDHVGPEDLPWSSTAVGTHTLNASTRFWVADICTVRFRGARWLNKLRAPQRPAANGR